MRVITVDDEKMVLENFAEKLRQIKRITDVATFLTPKEALEYLKENKADVAFLDINMRQMDGLTLAKAIKEISPNTYIIFVTGYTQYAVEAHKIKCGGYLMKPVQIEDIEAELDYMAQVQPKNTAKIRVQTFGNFEIFVNDVPVSFSRSKSKELLAYLIDRSGASATTRECFSVLWEDKEYTVEQERYFQKIVSDMLASLKLLNIQNIVIKKRNSIAVDITKFDCDLYNFVKQDMAAVNFFRGEYMAQYSWAEFTTGYLEASRK